MNTNTTAKVAARIVAATAVPGVTFRQAVTNAAREAVTEAQAAGWSERSIIGMMHTFANVAADMAAAAVKAA